MIRLYACAACSTSRTRYHFRFVFQHDIYAPHHERELEPDPMLEAGLTLPRALQREFPPELIATPIEDLDKYYENKMVS